MAGTAAHGTAKTKFRIFFFSYHGPSIPGSAQAPHASLQAASARICTTAPRTQVAKKLWSRGGVMTAR